MLLGSLVEGVTHDDENEVGVLANDLAHDVLFSFLGVEKAARRQRRIASSIGAGQITHRRAYVSKRNLRR